MVLAHQMDIFSKPMNIKSVLSVHEEMGSGFAGCLFKEKIHKTFFFASLETLIHFKCCPGSRLNIFVSALLLCYWSIFSNAQDHRWLHICITAVGSKEGYWTDFHNFRILECFPLFLGNS
jgi:hypothetical protein